jgi:hypothetical protein
MQENESESNKLGSPTADDEPTLPETFVRASDIDIEELGSETAAKRLHWAAEQIDIAVDNADTDWLDEVIAELLDDTRRIRDLAAEYEYDELERDSE